jgi:hypothetical protein
MGKKSRAKQQRKHQEDVRLMQQTILQGWRMARAAEREPFFFITEPHKFRILQDAINGIRNNPSFNGYHIQGFRDADNCAIQISKAQAGFQLLQRG